jgi:DNA-binding cell septation regulator SpoVG
VERDRALKGFADIEADGWIVRDFRIIVPNGEGNIFVDPPQRFFKDRETGEVKFKPILTIPKDARQIIVAAILSAYWEKVKGSYEKGQEPPI